MKYLLIISIFILLFTISCDCNDDSDSDPTLGDDDDDDDLPAVASAKVGDDDDDDDDNNDDNDDDNDDDDTVPSWLEPEPGLDELIAVEALPMLRYGTVARQFSSHDKDGGNDDGFVGGTQIYIDDNNEYVVFDDFGPGCIYRIWFTTIFSIQSQVKIYIDDMTTPIVDLPLTSLFNSSTFPFKKPVVGNTLQSSGGFISYIPICYQQRCKITFSLSPEFYNITYRRYDYQKTVTSFTGTEDYTRLFEQWDTPTADPKLEMETVDVQNSMTIPATSSQPLLQYQGQGAVWNLMMAVDPLNLDATSNLWLLAYWDGQNEPFIQAPVNEFFGSYDPDKAPQGLFLGINQGQYYCHLPMPFWQSAQLILENRSASDITVSYQIDLLEEPYPENAGYFSAQYHNEYPTTIGTDYLFAEVSENAGHYLGVTYTMLGPINGSYMEGDERFYLDGSRSPAIYGTGTEDYFNGGWYFIFGEFDLPLHGDTIHLERQGSSSRTGVYRMHAADLIPFFDQGRFGIEHDLGNENNEDNHSSVAYFYLRRDSLLQMTDQLDVGDTASESSHGFTAIDSAISGPLTSYFEGDFDDVPMTDTGRDTSGQSEFTMQIDPGHEGVFLRRTYDQSLGRQQAQVWVDGQFAGTWYEPFENSILKWAETDFPLPYQITKGKSSLSIRIVNDGDVPWSEYQYRIYNQMGVTAK